MRRSARRKPLRVVMEKGEPAAVILAIDEYKALLERLEDAEDLKLLEQMRRRPLAFRKLEEFLAAYSPSI